MPCPFMEKVTKQLSYFSYFGAFVMQILPPPPLSLSFTVILMQLLLLCPYTSDLK